MIDVVPIRGDAASQFCKRLLIDLPEWFGQPDSNANYVQDAKSMPGFVALQNGTACGLILLKKTAEHTLDIHLLAVEKLFHRQGVGKMLVAEAMDFACTQTCGFLTVSTLSPSCESPPYEATRKFYRKMGFQIIMEYQDSAATHPVLLICQVVKP